MHQEVVSWLTRSGFAELTVGPACDVGGRDVNGSARDLAPDAEWTVVDMVDGPDVDVVADVTIWPLPGVYQTVVSTEMLEHCRNWERAVVAMAEAVDVDGYLWITAASPKRTPHGAWGDPKPGPGEHYRGIPAPALLHAVQSVPGMVVVEMSGNSTPGDVYLCGRRDG